MCLFAPADVRKHITAGANKLWFKHSFSFNERKGSCFTSPPAETLSSQVLQMCWALTKRLALHTHAHKHTHIHTEQFSNMPLNGTTKYSPWFHKSCGWRSCVLPVPATGDKSALCVLSVLTDHQAIPPLD